MERVIQTEATREGKAKERGWILQASKQASQQASKQASKQASNALHRQEVTGLKIVQIGLDRFSKTSHENFQTAEQYSERLCQQGDNTFDNSHELLNRTILRPL